MPSDTWQTYALLRSNLKAGATPMIAKAVAYGKRLKLYPLSQAANPPATNSSTRSMSSIDATFLTTCGSSSRSIAWCKVSHG